uniref:Polyadenylate-binding protein n=1 Tax=Equus caballus TaxID=9796 RepID=A0A3Q2HY88_HORSE
MSAGNVRDSPSPAAHRLSFRWLRSVCDSGDGLGGAPLASVLDEAMLYEKFSTIGPILSIRFCLDPPSRCSLGYEYVNFSLQADTERSQRDPSLRESGVSNIFVKNLAKSIDTFSVFGNILSRKVVTNENGSRGFGFVHFEKSEAATRAVAKMSGILLKGSRVFVGQFKPRKERETELRVKANMFTNVYIKNFGDDIDDKCLKEVFGEFSSVLSVRVMTDESGKSKGFGFVSFEDAQKAIEGMNGKVLNGNRVYVGKAQNKVERLSELKHKFEQMKPGKLTRCNGANVYVKNLEDDIDDKGLRREFPLFGTITSARVMTERGCSTGFAIMAMNGKTVIPQPVHVAIAQGEVECQALLTQNYMERRADVGHGGNPRLNSEASSSNFMPILPQPQCGSADLSKPVVRTKPHPSQNMRYVIHSAAAAAPKPSFSTFRPPQVPAVKSPYHITNTATQTKTVHPQTSSSGSHANQRFKKVARVCSHLKFKVGRPVSIQKPVHICTQGHDMSNISVLASATTQEKILYKKLVPLVLSIQPTPAGEISRILLEMDDAEILYMLKYSESLRAKVYEAILILQSNQAQDTALKATNSTPSIQCV